MRSLMHWVTEVDWIWKAIGNKGGVLSVDVHMHPCILKRSLWLQGGEQTESWKGLEAGSQWRSYWSGSCKKYLGLEHRSQVRWRAGRVGPMMRTAHTEISIPTGAQWDHQICRKLAPQYHCLHPGTSKLSLPLTALGERHLSKLCRASEKSEIKFLKCKVWLKSGLSKDDIIVQD